MHKLSLGLLLSLSLFSQTKAQQLPAYAFKNVTIHTHDGKSIEKASIVWRNGSITDYGTKVSIPFDAKVTDGGDSLHIYPGFIDGFSEMAAPDEKPNTDRVEKPGEPPYDRSGIQPERIPSASADFSKKDVKDAQKEGFTSALIGLKGLMLPGQLDFFHLGGKDAQSNLLVSSLGQKGAFKNTRNVYPSTLMGTMYLFRQLWENASALQIKQQSYESNPTKNDNPGRDLTLEALYPVINKKQPLYFQADDKESIERILKLKKELGFDLVLVSAKEAFRYTDLLKKEKVPVLVSFDFPGKPDWKVKEEKAEKAAKEAKKDSTNAKTDSTIAKKVEKEVPADIIAFRAKQMSAYNDFVKNTKTLLDAGLNPGFSSIGLKWADFSKNIESMIEAGMTENELVSVLTENTAKVLGLSNQTGKIENGYLADFAVFTKPFTAKKAKLLQRVVKGEVYELN